MLSKVELVLCRGRLVARRSSRPKLGPTSKNLSSRSRKIPRLITWKTVRGPVPSRPLRSALTARPPLSASYDGPALGHHAPSTATTRGTAVPSVHDERVRQRLSAQRAKGPDTSFSSRLRSFTKEEDAILVQRLIQQKGVGLSGEAMYKRLEADVSTDRLHVRSEQVLTTSYEPSSTRPTPGRHGGPAMSRIWIGSGS